MKVNWFKLRLLIVLLAGSAEAQTTNSWDVGSGKWEAPGNWNNGAPSGNNAANFIWNATIPAGGGVTTVDATTAADSSVMTISNLLVGAGGRFGSSPHTLFLNNAGSITPLHILSSLMISNGATVTLTNSILKVDGATPACTDPVALEDDGILQLNNGTLVVGNGSFCHPGLEIGSRPGSSGFLSVNGGELVATNGCSDIIYIGGNGMGQMTVSDGTVLAKMVTVESGGTLTLAGGTMTFPPMSCGVVPSLSVVSSGTVWVTGGQLSAPFINPAGPDIAIDAGQMVVSNGMCQVLQTSVSWQTSGGTLTIAGGTNTLTELYIGQANNLTGTVWMTGGQLAGSVGIGVQGVGQMTVSNGICLEDAVYLGGSTGSRGTLTIAGGQLVTTNAINGTFVGYSGGVGQMTVSSGEWRAARVIIGHEPGSQGTLTIAGGSSSVYSNMAIGDCATNAVGTVSITGGSLFVTNATHNAVLDVRNGVVVLTGGLLQVDTLVMTNSCGLFVPNGGTLVVSNLMLDANLDADGDGIPNGYEQSHGLDPLNPADASVDSDGDGMSNLQEFLAGTDPHSNGSVLRIRSIVRQDSDVRITWTTAGGRTNAIQATNGTGGNYATNFIDLVTFVIAGSGDATNTFIDLGGATNTPSRYYRVRLVP